MRRSILAAGVALGALGVAVACEVAYPTHLTSDVPLGATDASDAGSDAPVEAGCARAVPPPPPETETKSGPDITITAAVQEFVFRGETDAGEPIGFDLDGVCTCYPDKPSCVSQQKACDGPGGRDQAGDKLLSLLDGFFAASSDGSINYRISKGRMGFIVWISGYNGEEDDASVFVSAFVSSGIIDDADAGSHTHPKWDGTDLWNIDSTLVAGATALDGGEYVYTPKVISTVGYVTKGTLVARLPLVDVGFEIARLRVNDAVFVAKISKVPAGFRLDGQFSGRMATADVIAAPAHIRDPTDSTRFLCGDDPAFITFTKAVCSSTDLARDPALDNTGAPCTALSLAFGLTAFSAKTGAPFVPKQVPNSCDGGVSDCPSQ